MIVTQSFRATNTSLIVVNLYREGRHFHSTPPSRKHKHVDFLLTFEANVGIYEILLFMALFSCSSLYFCTHFASSSSATSFFFASMASARALSTQFSFYWTSLTKVLSSSKRILFSFVQSTSLEGSCLQSFLTSSAVMTVSPMMALPTMSLAGKPFFCHSVCIILFFYTQYYKISGCLGAFHIVIVDSKRPLCLRRGLRHGRAACL